jgi:hypothetical protein
VRNHLEYDVEAVPRCQKQVVFKKYPYKIVKNRLNRYEISAKLPNACGKNKHPNLLFPGGKEVGVLVLPIPKLPEDYK